MRCSLLIGCDLGFICTVRRADVLVYYRTTRIGPAMTLDSRLRCVATGILISSRAARCCNTHSSVGTLRQCSGW